MTKHELENKTDAAIKATQRALQTIYDALNQGQQQKILKISTVAALFELYSVEIQPAFIP